jgi:DNA invertase Pin-like site-specific DNA recombinase
MTIRAAIYARSSPDCPLSNEDQIERLQTVAGELGWTATQVFTDRPASAKKCLDRRPGEVALIEAIRNGTINKVLIWSIDRIGKSLIEMIGFLEVCRVAGVGLHFHDQGVDTETSNGLSLFDVAAMMSLHVRQSRRDRILRGQAAARALSIRFGRPPIPLARQEKARRELIAGKGVREAARSAGISAASASRLKNAMSVAAPVSI